MIEYLIISAVFPPELTVSGKVAMDIAIKLSDMGKSVKVITAFPSRPLGKVFNGYRRKPFSNEILYDGKLNVLRVFTILSKKPTITSRLFENVSFGVSTAIYLTICKKPAAVYSNSWPIFASGLLSLICRLRNIPYFVVIQDMYPESLLAQNRKINGYIIKILSTIDRFISVNASGVFTISKYFQNKYVYSRGVLKSKVHYVPNWASAPKNNESSESIRNLKNIPGDSFIVVVGGNIGVAAGVEGAIETFNKFINDKNIILLIAGDGNRFNTCESLAHNNSTNSIRFYRPWPKEETSLVLSSADIFLVPTISGQSRASVPSKIISYMFAGKPIIVQAYDDTEVAEIIKNANCGWVVEPGDNEKLGKLISDIPYINKSELSEMGSNGKNYAMEKFSKEKCLPKVINVIVGNQNEDGRVSTF